VEACLNLPKERYAMTSSSTVVSLRQPDAIDDPLTAILRSGARRLLAQAIEAEADAFLATMKGVQLPDGRDRLVRHGHGPEREVQTGIGPVAVQRVRLRDRGAGEAGAERIRFTSAILPRWARRTRSLDALLPILYLRGVSMGDFQEALGALLGRDAPNLSPAVIARLRGEWEADYTRWQRRDLSARHYVYVWADGVYLQARMEPQAECRLVLIGATPEGKKELVGFQVGVRESAQSWRELLVGLKARGLAIAPELATGDGALGFWKALEGVVQIRVTPKTRNPFTIKALSISGVTWKWHDTVGEFRVGHLFTPPGILAAPLCQGCGWPAVATERALRCARRIRQQYPALFEPRPRRFWPGCRRACCAARWRSMRPTAGPARNAGCCSRSRTGARAGCRRCSARSRSRRRGSRFAAAARLRPWWGRERSRPFARC